MLYHARHFESASVGVRVVEVTCDKCRCEYYYELARVGSGSASAPYGIGNKGAAQSAAEQAQRDLGERLRHEAELVPCPKCGWINEGLVAGYRLGRYRGWANFAAAVAIVGSATALVGAWFVSDGPPADSGAAPYILIVGLGTSLPLAALVLLLRRWLRGRIQPNQDFPLPPTLPPGCPTPLLVNQATGQLEAAGPRRTDEGRDGIDFQVGRHELPPVCCECLNPAEPRSGFRHPVFPAVELVVPLCAGCSRTRKRRTWFLGLLAFATTVAIGSAALALLVHDEVVCWILFGGLALVALYVGAAFAHRSTAPVRVKGMDDSRGIVRLWFRNDDYQKLLASTVGARA